MQVLDIQNKSVTNQSEQTGNHPITTAQGRHTDLGAPLYLVLPFALPPEGRACVEGEGHELGLEQQLVTYTCGSILIFTCICLYL